MDANQTRRRYMVTIFLWPYITILECAWTLSSLRVCRSPTVVAPQRTAQAQARRARLRRFLRTLHPVPLL